tara:strand:+ start:172 stop:954 length:783 start_codon:yes stop_codon:yes gene_type:complete
MIKKQLIKKVPILKRFYPYLFKKIFKFFKGNKINYNYFGVNFEGNIEEPMDKEILLFEGYENFQINFLLKNINDLKFDYFIDVGANSGLYSLIVAKRFKHISVKSFEPISESVNKLKKNITLNTDIKNIEVFNFGLSNKNSKLLMKALKKRDYIQKGGYGVVNKSDDLTNLHTEYAEFKLGDEVLNLTDKNIIIKIDTEGHEKNVLEGLKNIFINNKIFLQIEIFDKNYSTINQLIESYNLKKIKYISSDNKIDYYYKNY